ncbi:MAG: hypothetical protein L7F78_19415 [Syntrophales bacterium LBB04]|nr:hypothetical protein [Syntrophales bacterium LBB04]
MRAYIGFDDTDNHDSDFGTGKVARRFENLMPEGCHMWGVVRQQLLFDERIPYTSHNSAAHHLLDHIKSAAPGSDPGLCFGEGDFLAWASVRNTNCYTERMAASGTIFPVRRNNALGCADGCCGVANFLDKLDRHGTGFLTYGAGRHGRHRVTVMGNAILPASRGENRERLGKEKS